MEILVKFRLGWLGTGINPEGREGGLFAFWNPAIYNIKSYRFFGGIMLSGYIKGHPLKINIINLYAPCVSRAIL